MDDCLLITDEGARSSDHRPLSIARDSPHGWPEATLTFPGRSTLELWQLRSGKDRAETALAMPIQSVYGLKCRNSYDKKKAPFRTGQRHFFESFGLLQTTQRITAIPATTRARHPTNVRIARSLITGSLRIMSSTEMPHLAIRRMHGFCSATKRAMNLWLTLNFNQFGDSIRIVRRMDDRLRSPGRMRGKTKLHQAPDGLRPARCIAAIAAPKIDLFQQHGMQPNLHLFAPARGRPPALSSPNHIPHPTRLTISWYPE